ncbi:MAG: hypothetical protein ACKOCN_11970, partial [Planctomycetaceae bacterium]
FLFMAGGPSQPDLFDPKELLRRRHGESIAPPVDPTLETVGTDRQAWPRASAGEFLQLDDRRRHSTGPDVR